MFNLDLFEAWDELDKINSSIIDEANTRQARLNLMAKINNGELAEINKITKDQLIAWVTKFEWKTPNGIILYPDFNPLGSNSDLDLGTENPKLTLNLGRYIDAVWTEIKKLPKLEGEGDNATYTRGFENLNLESKLGRNRAITSDDYIQFDLHHLRFEIFGGSNEVIENFILIPHAAHNRIHNAFYEDNKNNPIVNRYLKNSLKSEIAMENSHDEAGKRSILDKMNMYFAGKKTSMRQYKLYGANPNQESNQNLIISKSEIGGDENDFVWTAPEISYLARGTYSYNTDDRMYSKSEHERDADLLYHWTKNNTKRSIASKTGDLAKGLWDKGVREIEYLNNLKPVLEPQL